MICKKCGKPDGRNWLGIELNPDYIKIAEERFQQQEIFK
mgnify:CR=1 FL=1